MKKIKVLIVLIISLGALFCAYYFLYPHKKLNKDYLSSIPNVYLFDIFKEKTSFIDSVKSGNYIYYLLSDEYDNVDGNDQNDVNERLEDDNMIDDGIDMEINYTLNKYDLFKNKLVASNTFTSLPLYGGGIVLNKDNTVDVISTYNKASYYFDKDLKLIEKSYEKMEDDYNKIYGTYLNKTISVEKNIINYDNKEYAKLDNECGDVVGVNYTADNTYIYFNNTENDLSCLYDMKNKKTINLISDAVILFNNGYLYNRYNYNKVSIVVNDKLSEYYINESISYDSMRASDDGKLLFTIESDLNKGITYLRIYDLNNNILIHKKELKMNENEFIDLLSIDDYAYYVKYNGSKYELYAWDYNKDELLNEHMNTTTSINYRFNNIKKINELNDKYSIKILAYEDSVRYIDSYYALPSSDDYSIYKSLNTLEEVLSMFNKEFFKKFIFGKNRGIKIYLNDKLGPSDEKDQISNPAGYSYKYKNDYMISLDINEYSLKQNICHEIMHTIESNLDDRFFENKISSYQFNSWDELNPKNYSYQYSYVDEANYKYTPGNGNTVYFVSYYSHTYPTEDRATVFENFCTSEEENVILKYPKIKAKAKKLKSIIEKNYPSMKNSSIFDILKES